MKKQAKTQVSVRVQQESWSEYKTLRNELGKDFNDAIKVVLKRWRRAVRLKQTKETLND
jgi:hypothetical protein